MRLFEFAKWWWARNDEFTRTATCYVIFWAIPCAIAAIWFGKDAFLAAVIGIFVVFAGWALYGIFVVLSGMWDKFNDEHPPEEIAIMRRLKGIPTPSKPESVYYD